MGNVQVHDFVPATEVARTILDLSVPVNYDTYAKHLKGCTLPGSHQQLPNSVIDSVCLYTHLKASFNNLTSIPVEIPLRIPHLVTVDISHNSVYSLPESFCLFYHLEVLDVSYNKLRQLPETFSRLPRLQKLDLANNRMEFLPKSLGDLSTLTKLNVNSNRLRELPISLGRAAALNVVLARDNKLQMPPQNIANQGSKQIMEHLRDQARDAVLPNDHHQITRSFNIFKRSKTASNSGTVKHKLQTPLRLPENATMLSAHDLSDRIVGMIYGSILGDVVGLMTDRMSTDEAHFHYDPATDFDSFANRKTDDHRVQWPVGEWSSRTDMLVLCLESMLHWAGVVDELDYVKRLKTWMDFGYPELGDRNGRGLERSISNLAKSNLFLTDPHQAASNYWKDLSNWHNDESTVCSSFPLATAIILSVPHFHRLSETSENALRVCRTTHDDPRCGACVVAVATMLAALLQGRGNVARQDYLDEILQLGFQHGRKQLENAPNFGEEFARSIIKFDHSEFRDACRSAPGMVTTATSCASVALSLATPSFKENIVQLAMIGGSARANCQITGAVLGCKVGYSKLPRVWLDQLARKDCLWLDLRINQLLDLMALS